MQSDKEAGLINQADADPHVDTPEVEMGVGDNVIAFYGPSSTKLRRTCEVYANGKLVAVGSRRLLYVYIAHYLRKWRGG